MGKLLTLLFIVFSTITLSSQLRLGAALESDLNNVAIKGQLRLGLTDELAIQGSLALYLSSPVATMLNFDGHYLLTTAGDLDRIKVNALAGLNYWSSGVDGDDSELGLNAGANITFPIWGELDMFIEPKFTLFSRASFNVALGVYF